VKVTIGVWPVAAAIFLSACGTNTASPTSSTPPASSQPPPTGGGGPPSGGGPPTVNITAAGFVPSEVSTTVGSRVTFVNSDTRPHDMLGGPDHTRLDCPEVDVVGFIVPGQSRDTGIFAAGRVCEFHDHNNVGNPAFQGRIIVR
jgi:plastocyanin